MHILVDQLVVHAHAVARLRLLRHQRRFREGVVDVIEDQRGFGEWHAIVDQRGYHPVRIELQVRGVVLVATQRHYMVFGLLALFHERDAYLLGADRIDAVVEFEHVILPVMLQAVARSTRGRTGAVKRGTERESTMTQRLPGVSDQDARGVAKDIIEGSNLLLGRTSNLLRILAAHTPYLARWFLGLVAAVRQPTLGAVSDVRLRNLATIKTSMVNACQYCATHTSIFGQALGLKDQELAALQGDSYRTSLLFNERERAVIAWSEAVTLNTAKSDQALWETMRQLFSDAEIVEITMATAMFNMINRLNDTFWTDLETIEYNRRQGNAVHGLTIEAIEAYASRFAASQRHRPQLEAAEHAQSR